MSQFQITCEAEDPMNQKVSHLPPYFYCSLCNLTICTTCLIKHLCTVQHTDPNSIIPIDKVIEKRKEKIKQLKNEWKERADSLPSNKVEKVFIGKGGWLKLGNPKPLSLLEENKKKFCEKIRYKFKPKTTKKTEDTNNNSISRAS